MFYGFSFSCPLETLELSRSCLKDEKERETRGEKETTKAKR